MSHLAKTLPFLLLASVAAAEGAHQPINLTFFYPLGTNQNPATSANFRINALYGRLGGLGGLDVNGLVSRIDGDVKGLQITGAYSHIYGEFEGVSFTGGVTYVRGKASGLQFSGLANYVRDSFSGLQYSTFFNYTERGFRGAQIAATLNITNGESGAFQLSALANLAAGDFRGFQIAPGVSFVGGRLTGMQAALVNFADEFHGAQFGFANFAFDGRGLAIGVVNMITEFDGVPIGLVSFERNSPTSWVTFGSNLAAISTGVRTIVNDWQSILAVGGVDVEDDLNDTLFFSWHYGHRFRHANHWYLIPDVGFLHIEPQPAEEPDVNDESHFAVQFRFALEREFSTMWSVFVGGGLSAIWDEYSSEAGVKTEPLAYGGIALFQ